MYTSLENGIITVDRARRRGSGRRRGPLRRGSEGGIIMLKTLLACATGRRRIVRLPGEPGKRPVVLVHGLLHRGCHLRHLARMLNRDGRPVWLYDYPTTRARVVVHGIGLARFLRTLPREPVDVVTHSMGGLLLRVAADELRKSGESDRIGRVVMLAPPNHGSGDAEAWVSRFPPSKLLIRPLDDLSDRTDAAVHFLPVPAGLEIGVIAGDRDRRVTVDSTHLDGESDHLTVRSGHSFIMEHREVHEAVRRFLDTGSFRPES